MPRWSEPKHFDEDNVQTYAPREAGVYQIGFYRSGNFTPSYLGRALGNKTSIHSRLLNHLRGNGNAYIAEYQDTRLRNHLYFRYMRSFNPAQTEASLLNRFGIGEDGLFEWNQRLENFEQVGAALISEEE